MSSETPTLQPSAPVSGQEPARIVGTSAPRKEDARLLFGAGQYTGDVSRAHVAEMAVARCPFPHARIRAIDARAALAMPGIYHIMTGKDAVARSGSVGLLRPDPGATAIPLPPLAADIATYEGQGVVSIAAATRHLAEDAVQALEIEYEPLPHVTDIDSALAPDAPVIYPDLLPTNQLTATDEGRGDVAARFREADVVAEGHFVINRVTGLPMEGRAVLAEWHPGARELTVHVSSQVPHIVRRQLAELLDLPEGNVRVITRDVGGGFGLKLSVYPEDILAALHAMALRRPVRWLEDRNEHFRATTHARESAHDYRIAARSDGTILAMEDVYTNDLGAASFAFGASQQSTIVFSGPYRVTDGHVGRRVVVTNKTPVGAYRGFGQPEVNFACERVIDRLARRLGMDPVEFRARNMVKAAELPWVNPVGAVYDSGDYERSLRTAAAAIDYDSYRAGGRGPSDAGRYRGIGFSAYVERTGTPSSVIRQGEGAMFGVHESVTIRASYSGGIDVYSGVSSFGQGSETVFAQMCSEFTGIDYDRIAVHVGDTATSPLNTGGFASRTVIAAAGALQAASERFRGKMLRIAAWMLEIGDPPALEVVGDSVRCRDNTGLQVLVKEVFARAIIGEDLPPGETPGLEETAYFSAPSAAYAFGTAAAAVTVDSLTGDFDIERIVMVHDSGTPINPSLVEGQVRGGIVQALGAALGEELRYDGETGQLVNGTMMDYFAPLACDIPPIELISTDIPSPVTPLGIRGAGESGAIPVAAAVANAICEALSDFGIELDRLPITPEAVWTALRTARGG
jgi:aerobic carbon-monoxide dehydrogenase large subunit